MPWLGKIELMAGDCLKNQEELKIIVPNQAGKQLLAIGWFISQAD